MGMMEQALYDDYQREAFEDLADECPICGTMHIFDETCHVCGGPDGVKADLTFKLTHRPRPNPARLGLYLATLRTIFPG